MCIFVVLACILRLNMTSHDIINSSQAMKLL